MSRSLIIMEKTPSGFSAYAPDLPGCVATGRTRDEVQAELNAAIEFHLEGMMEAGETIPVPSSEAAYCEFAGDRHRLAHRPTMISPPITFHQ